MKTHYVLLVCLLIAVKTTYSQIFLKGNFVEIGIHSTGSFGSDVAPPANYHPTHEYLGFVCDFQKDGWNAGTPPFIGDYFVPGTPEEGWGIKWGINSDTHIYNNFGLMYVNNIPRISEDKYSDNNCETAVWSGEAGANNEKLLINQKIILRKDALYFTIEIMVKNTGTDTLKDVKYYRNLDPDNEVAYTGDYCTSNYVKNQPGYFGNTDTAIVIAKGFMFNVPVILGTIDNRARVAYGGFSNRDPDQILNTCQEPNPQTPHFEDEAISLVFKLGDIIPGQCLSFSYYYGLEEINPAIAMVPLSLDFTTSNTCGTKKIDFQNTSNGSGSMLITNCFWDFNDDKIFEETGMNSQHTFPEYGTYSVKMKIETCDGQTDTITKEIRIQNYPSVKFSADTVLCKGETLILNAANKESQYVWQDGTVSPVFYATETRDYSVWITNECGVTYDKIHAEFIDCDITIPNIFTPNNDSQNDMFKITDIEFGNWQIEIFNRWGLLLYKGTKIEEWDTEKSETGVYYYLVYNTDISVCKKGFFHLVR